jgi:predicted MFS family arabinose efflux permease
VPSMSFTSASDQVRPTRRQLPHGLALAGTAIAFTSMYLSAGALTPLLVAYKQEWGFAPSMLNLAFAVYAVGFLLAALTLGSLSDYLGRRPVLVASLVVQLASSVLFLVGNDIGWAIAGRVVQGVAGGAATSAFTAALVEFAPEGRKRAGALLGAISLTGGLAIGSLLAGWAIEVTPSANTIVFIVLIALTLIGAAAVWASPEPVTRAEGAARSLIPHVAIPAGARSEFWAAAPVVAAVWMLAGLSGGLAPSMVSSVFHHHSALLGGFAGFVAPAVGTLTGVLVGKMVSRQAMLLGIYASLLGSTAIIAGVFAESLPLMLIGQAVAGVGFGAAFTAALQLLIPLVAPRESAGLVAAIYIVAYFAFGVPIVVEGQLVGTMGEIPAVVAYTGFTILLALISLVGQRQLKRRQ